MYFGGLLVISGPSGSGKSSLLKELFKSVDNCYFSVSTTTREIRDGEEDGVDYHFVKRDEFEDGIKNGEFLEWAEVHNNLYGTSKKSVLKAISDGKLVVFDIDVQGYFSIRDEFRDILSSVFITTSTLNELKNRLTKRGSDSIETIDRRLEHAKKEIAHFREYDYLLLNIDFKSSSQNLISIARSTLLKSSIYDKNKIIDKFIS